MNRATRICAIVVLGTSQFLDLNLVPPELASKSLSPFLFFFHIFSHRTSEALTLSSRRRGHYCLFKLPDLNMRLEFEHGTVSRLRQPLLIACFTLLVTFLLKLYIIGRLIDHCQCRLIVHFLNIFFY